MKFLVHKSQLISQLIKQEDTSGSYTITVEDMGSKEFYMTTDSGTQIKIEGTYYLSNLLQEAALLPEESGYIDLEHIYEAPVTRISRVIKTYYWDKLTRSFDNDESLLKVLEDEKMQGEILRLYVPETDTDGFEFYKQKERKFKNFKIETIPEHMSTEAIMALNEKPGILALAYSKEKGKSIPFVVPGGRFNEMYGWDSYFIGLGLISDGKFELAEGMIDNLEYQILHYGKILNANRSYYLTRSQPPFFTSFITLFYETYPERLSLDWLQQKLTTALSEYFNVWMTEGVRLTSNGLNRYFGEGIGVPKETEPGHFDAVFEAFAEKHQQPFAEFKADYENGFITDDALDMYFIHDRSMRESGHDTTNRLDNCSAFLNTVDLNSLLFKFETDIAYLIQTYFKDTFNYKDTSYSSAYWTDRSHQRQKLMVDLMWNDAEGSFYDYNFHTQNQQRCISASNFYPLWANLCTDTQARIMIDRQLPLLVCKGGVASTSPLEPVDRNQPERQWDFPYGWAPHQILIWEGLNNYSFNEKSQELIYRWLWLMVKTVVDYNGLIPEKFNVNACTHQVDVEYGNVGAHFKYVTDGGFGWTNASFKVGLQLLEPKYMEHLNALTDPDALF